MPGPDWLRVRQLFERLVELPREEHAGILRDEGSEVRAEVERLLGLHEHAETAFLEPSTDLAWAAPTLVGKRLGHYAIESQIAEGGMGVVYRARQERPDREVAVKVLRLEFATPIARQRFEYESEILGRLTHPGIAQVYEAGSCPAPVGDYEIPFIAMEYVAGARTIAEFAGEEDVDDQVRLFRDVCAAVHFAHQNGVIHRDLKPSNILIDAAGRPKVIDFGIAKATSLGQTLTRSTGQIAGTLRYMSPEQLESKAVDIRTDVYSFGLVMYEILGGEPAFRFDGASLPEVMRIIHESEPAPLGAIRPDLPIDLQWIVRKAIDKDPDRRYQTMHELSLDLARLQEHVPVIARAPSLGYTLRKFVRRNRTQVASAALIFVSLVVGLVVSTTQYFEAQARATESEEVTRVMLDLFAYAAPDKSIGEKLPVHALIDASAHRIASQLQDQPRVRGRLLRALSDAYQELGLDEKSLATAEKGIRVLEQSGDAPMIRWELAVIAAATLARLGRIPEAEARTAAVAQEARELGDPERMARAHHLLGVVKQVAGASGEARTIMAEAMAQIEEHCNDVLYRAQARRRYATILLDAGDLRAARAQFTRCISGLREAHPGGHPTLAVTLSQLARCLIELDEPSTAVVHADEAVAESLRIFGPRHPHHARILLQRAYVRGRVGQRKGALEDLRKGLDIETEYLSPEHPHIAWTLNDLAVGLAAVGRTGEAVTTYDRALDIYKRAHPNGHRDFVIVLNNAAELRAELDRHEEAMQLARRALEMNTQLGGDGAASGRANTVLAYGLNSTGRCDQALTCALAALEHLPADTENKERRARANYYVAWAHMGLGSFQRAEPYFKESLRLFDQVYPDGHPMMAFPLGHYGHGLQAERIDEAIPLFERAFAIRKKHLKPTDNWFVASARQLGSAYARTGAWAKAVDPLREVFDAIAALGPIEARTERTRLVFVQTGELLIEGYEKSGQSAEARKIRERLGSRRGK